MARHGPEDSCENSAQTVPSVQVRALRRVEPRGPDHARRYARGSTLGSATTAGQRSFTGERKAAWELFLQSQARLMQQLGHELDDAGKVALSTYDVLVQLAENGGRLRLRDLVDRVVLSQPGLSRKVARLEQEGLVQRLPDPSDGRGVLVRLTRGGRAALRSAAVVHIAGVERVFTDRISEEEATVLARVFRRVLAPPTESG
jgi:DNA-binding MarR family transcriptional regulator